MRIEASELQPSPKIAVEDFDGETVRNTTLEIGGMHFNLSTTLLDGYIGMSLINAAKDTHSFALTGLNIPFTTARTMIETAAELWEDVDHYGFNMGLSDYGKGDTEEDKAKAVVQRETLFERTLTKIYGEDIVYTGNNKYTFKKFLDEYGRHH